MNTGFDGKFDFATKSLNKSKSNLKQNQTGEVLILLIVSLIFVFIVVLGVLVDLMIFVVIADTTSIKNSIPRVPQIL